MPQIDKKRADDSQGLAGRDPDAPTCPKCGSATAKVVGTIAGRTWLRCGACAFNFSIDAANVPE